MTAASERIRRKLLLVTLIVISWSSLLQHSMGQHTPELVLPTTMKERRRKEREAQQQQKQLQEHHHQHHHPTNSASVLEQLWESLQHRMQNSQTPQLLLHQQQQVSQQESSSSTLTAPHVSTRGGPYVSSRRRSLYEHGLHQHYSQQLHHYRKQQEQANDGESSSNNNNSLNDAFQTLFTFYQYEPAGQRAYHRMHADRTSSLHAAFPPMPGSKREANLKLLRNMFQHAFDSYMYQAWPAPEIRPLSCQPGTFDLVKIQGLTLLDSLDTLLVLGNTTEFARSVERLRQQHATQHLFNVNENVSLFETTIRVLGGLLSAHQMAEAFTVNQVLETEVFTDDGHVRWGYPDSDEEWWRELHQGTCPSPRDWMGAELFCDDDDDDEYFYSVLGECRASSHHATNKTTTAEATRTTRTHNPADRYWKYDGFLLELAKDIGERLFPAFANTKTGIPYGTVNLRTGVPKGETTVASLAGGGTLTLEFELLSRLTGDDRFGKAAKLASRALWMRRSTTNRNLNLFGKHIDIQKGHWTETLSGIGSNSDSFLEYLVKHYILFPEDEDFWTMTLTAYSGVFEHSRLGEWYVDTDMSTGAQYGRSRHVLESLMAFYPGMQILLGETTPAARSLNSFFIVRELMGFLPERFNFGVWNVDGGRGHASLHPLRPELLESCYFLHKATQDVTAGDSSGWLWAADFALHKLETVTRTACGYSTVRDLRPQTTGTVDGSVNLNGIQLVDDMPSFFLSETIKYLYLTFDESNILHLDDERRWIFTTEAHPIHYVAPAVEVPVKVPFENEIESLKVLLHDKLQDGRRKRKSSRLISSRDGSDTMEKLLSEKWSDSTTHIAYSGDLALCRADMARSRTMESNVDAFFKERQVVDVCVPVNPDRDSFYDMNSTDFANLAHRTLKNTGVGSGRLLRKACPNIYSSDLLWLHALSGGAVDYSDVYVSVTSDNTVEHPHFFVTLGPSDALGLLGSGIHPMDLERSDADAVCPVLESARTMDTETTAVKGAEDVSALPNGTRERTAQIAMDANDFRVSTFSDGAGFVAEHQKTGDKIITTFVHDEQQEDTVYALVYAGYLSDEMQGPADTASLVHTPASLWRKNRKHTRKSSESASADGIHAVAAYHRNVIMADFKGNSFSCEIELLRRDVDADDKEDISEPLLVLPCAPGLFGKTHMAQLSESNSIFVEAVIMTPSDGDEMGCADNEANGSAESEKNATTARSILHDDPPKVVVAPSAVSENSKKDDPLGTIQVVHRGDCTFYSKAINMKERWGAEAVIVVNTEDDELFVMSHDDSDNEAASLDSDDVPFTVLVTGLDGEDLLSIVNSEAADDGKVAARISMRRQNVGMTNNRVVITGGTSNPWPGVRGTENVLQIFAKGGWGLQAASRADNLGWDLQLLHYSDQ